ncbi:MAG: inositol monophosphatase, partial [Porticoccaceae bacterium]|nr:inositol monophosphatase [Porticoccaceae bacterium]
MSAETIEQRYAFAQQLAREAGALALGYFNDLASLTIQSKGVQDMATEADINTEKLIRQRLSEHYPQDGFFGEETGADLKTGTSQGTWVVDPIDGTHPFVSGMALWCISIAYLENEQVLLGVIYDPNRDELFCARRGHGAFLNDRPMVPSNSQGLNDGLTGIGFSSRVPHQKTLQFLDRFLQQGGAYHRIGSGALSIAYVACGRLIGYVEQHMNAWDCLAGILLVEEAGGLSA